MLTFDDGPLPPYTNRVLDVLAEHCVKANYFLVGRMARGYPDLARRILAEGHTVGTHSENHLLGFDHAPIDTVKNEIEQGIVSVGGRRGQPRAVSPFFRIPGFLRRREVETYLQSRHLTTWSADLVADDWRHINASEVVRRAIARLDEKGKGILLLHDIQPATALALPELLRELKARGLSHRTGGAGQAAKYRCRLPQSHAAVAGEMPATADVAASLRSRRSAPHRDRPRSSRCAALPVARRRQHRARRRHSVDPARPFTSGSRPSRNMPTSDKFVTTEPGGWPPTISVPVPRAGGIGVSSRAGVSQTPDGRFQER